MHHWVFVLYLQARAGTDVGYGETRDSEVLEDFSDSFVRWVTYGEAICH